VLCGVYACPRGHASTVPAPRQVSQPGCAPRQSVWSSAGAPARPSPRPDVPAPHPDTPRTTRPTPPPKARHHRTCRRYTPPARLPRRVPASRHLGTPTVGRDSGHIPTEHSNGAAVRLAVRSGHTAAPPRPRSHLDRPDTTPVRRRSRTAGNEGDRPGPTAVRWPGCCAPFHGGNIDSATVSPNVSSGNPVSPHASPAATILTTWHSRDTTSIPHPSRSNMKLCHQPRCLVHSCLGRLQWSE